MTDNQTARQRHGSLAVESDNMLIAEFMGAKWWPKSNNIFKRYSNCWEFPGWRFGVRTSGLKYDTSWLWMMLVIERIDKLYREAFPPGDKFIEMILNHEKPIDSHYMDVVALPLGTPIQEVHEAVVKFIHWYNDSKAKA